MKAYLFFIFFGLLSLTLKGEETSLTPSSEPPVLKTHEMRLAEAVGLRSTQDSFFALLPKGTKLGTSKTHIFQVRFDGSPKYILPLCAGNEETYSKNRFIGAYVFSGFPLQPQKRQIEMKFTISTGGALIVTAKEYKTDKIVTVDFYDASAMPGQRF